MPGMSDPARGALPEVLARLAHDTGARPLRTPASGSTRLVGMAICALIFVMVILAGTGQLL